MVDTVFIDLCEFSYLTNTELNEVDVIVVSALHVKKLKPREVK